MCEGCPEGSTGGGCGGGARSSREGDAGGGL